MYNIRVSLVCDVYWKWQHCHNNHHNCTWFWIDVTNKHFHPSIPNQNRFWHRWIVSIFYFHSVFFFSIAIGVSHTLPFSARSLLEIDIAFKVFIAFCSRCSHSQSHRYRHSRKWNHINWNGVSKPSKFYFAQGKKCVSRYRFHNIYFVAAALRLPIWTISKVLHEIHFLARNDHLRNSSQYDGIHVLYTACAFPKINDCVLLWIGI